MPVIMREDQCAGGKDENGHSASATSEFASDNTEESDTAVRRKRKFDPSSFSNQLDSVGVVTTPYPCQMAKPGSEGVEVRRFVGAVPCVPLLLPVNNLTEFEWDRDQYLKEYWNNLKIALDAIYEQRPIARSIEYLFQTVNDICAIRNQTESLFRDLSEECRLHATKLLELLTQNENDTLTWLTQLNNIWCLFCRNMSMIRCIFLPLDRKLPNCGTIWHMGLKTFENVILLNSSVKEKLVDGLLWLVKCERTGEQSNKVLVKNLFHMLSTVSVYSSLFEKRFLRTTEAYYEAEGRRLMNEIDVPAFMNYVNETLQGERERANFYVGSEASLSVISAAQRGLIGHHLSAMLEKGLNDMLDHFQIDQLHLLYKLCRHAPAGHETLCNAVSSYLTKMGKQLACNKEDEDSIIPELLNFKDKCDLIITQSFENNELFLNSFRRGFEEVIISCPHKPAELIARFIDSKLRSGRVVMPEEDLDQLMDKVLVLFRFVPGKDMFEAFYQKYLAKRLLQSKSASFDAEKALLSKLKQECGSDFTAKLEAMFKDMHLSKELNSSFKQWLQSSKRKDKASMDMSVNVLTTGSWPSYPTSTVTLPADMQSYVERFQKFYADKHGGRVLSWQYSVGSCVVLANFGYKNEKELLVSPYQAIVLSLFNSRNELTFEEIRASTAIEEEELRRTLQSLACGKFRVILKHPMEKDKEHTYEQVRQGRVYQVDASTVRIMKMKKKLSHNALIAELSAQLRFQAKPNELKERIESMIEQALLLVFVSTYYFYLAFGALNDFPLSFMGNKSTKNHLENAQKTGVCQLSGCKLKKVPAQLLSCGTSLRSLNLRCNRLAELPSFISYFENLKHLTLDSNRLTFLPNEIGLLPKLEQLSVSNNMISALPETIGELKRLKLLNLSVNSFKEFPTVLFQMTQIDVIDLSCNKITCIPDGIQTLGAVELNLNQNQLSSISESIADCSRLKVLRVEENCLAADSFWCKILSDSQIALLAVEGNLFDMREFRELDGYQRYMERFTATKRKMMLHEDLG
ncbi:leucine Rich repeat-containing domain protein [Trichuris suis]|nr:leucine Rich repeat-containing domain protein [Trichuris suis]